MDDHSNLFTHIILTRFNLCSGSSAEIRQRNANNWLEYRFELFEKYCLPSVLNQTNQNFSWFIFFDINTPDIFKNKIELLAKQHPNIKPFWVKKAPLGFIQKCISQQLSINNQLLITTRLDNDDAINKRFIELIQERIIKTKDTINSPTVLNYDYGLCLKKSRTYKHTDKSNAFASLVEPINKELNTIWRYQHTQLNRFNLINLTEPAMWLQVIHGTNISNRIRGVRVKTQVIVNHFVLQERPPFNDNKFIILLENLTLSPLRFFKELCRSRIKIINSLAKDQLLNNKKNKPK